MTRRFPLGIYCQVPLCEANVQIWIDVPKGWSPPEESAFSALGFCPDHDPKRQSRRLRAQHARGKMGLTK